MTETTSEKPKSSWRKWLKYLSNALLLTILLILVIPTWRKGFQLWYTQLTLTEVSFEKSEPIAMPENEQTWELFDSEGNIQNFAENKGKPVVVSFWASWCLYCKASFPDLANLRNEFEDDITFMAVTTEPLSVLQAEKEKHDYDFLYCSQYYPPFFQIQVFPTLVILDKEMNMVYKLEGGADVDNEQNVKFLKELL